MQKTRLGVSVGLFGAAICFMGLINTIPMVLMAGYVLLFEQNEWLRKTAVKAVGIVVLFGVLSAFVSLLSNSTSLLNGIVQLFKSDYTTPWVGRFVSIFRDVITLAQSVFLLMLGFKSFKQGNVKLSTVDKTISEHM